MNETTIRVVGKFVTVRQKSLGVPVEKWDATRYKHRITVHVDGKYRMFSFYGSVFDYQNRRDMLEKGELVGAFRCFVGDALTLIDGDATPDIMKECVDVKRKFNELGVSDDDLYKISEALLGGDYGGRSF